MDVIVEKLPSHEPGEEVDPPLRIALVGRPNVGKSSIVNCLTGKNSVLVNEIPGTTRDSTDTRLKVDGRDVVIVDTAGLKRITKLKESLEYYERKVILEGLSANNQNKEATAKALSIDLATLYRKMKKLDIRKD